MTVNNSDTEPYQIEVNKSLSESEGAETGPGGGVMDVWGETREYKLNNLISGSFDNKSSFQIPTGIVPVTNYGDDISNAEVWVGTSARGLARGGNSLPLAGTVSIRVGESDVASKETDGEYAISSPPSDGVVTGGGMSSTSSKSLIFEPSSGFTFEQESLTTGKNDINIDYGTVQGTVTDYTGKEMKGERIEAELQSTGESIVFYSDGSGSYSSGIPGGETVIVNVPNANVEASDTVAELSSKTIDIQYSGMEITLELPNGVPAKNAPVVIRDTGVKGNTDVDGKVTFTKVPVLKNVMIQIYGIVEETRQSAGQGVLGQETITFGVGFQGRASNVRGDAVRSVDVKVVKDGDEYISLTDNLGDYAVGSPVVGEVRLVVAEESKRFQTKSVRKQVVNGEIVNQDVELSERNNIGNSN